MTNHIGEANKMIKDTPRTDTLMVAWDLAPDPKVLIGLARQLERELNAANERLKRLEEALDCVTVSCSGLHHSKKHQHKSNEPCPVEELIRKAKEAKP